MLIFISFLSAGVAASGNSFSEPVSEKIMYIYDCLKAFCQAPGWPLRGNSFSEPCS